MVSSPERIDRKGLKERFLRIRQLTFCFSVAPRITYFRTTVRLRENTRLLFYNSLSTKQMQKNLLLKQSGKSLRRGITGREQKTIRYFSVRKINIKAPPKEYFSQPAVLFQHNFPRISEVRHPCGKGWRQMSYFRHTGILPQEQLPSRRDGSVSQIKEQTHVTIKRENINIRQPAKPF